MRSCVGVGRISGATVWRPREAVGAGPALLCFPGGGEEVAVAGPRMVGVVVTGVPGATSVGGTVGLAGTLGPAQHWLATLQSLWAGTDLMLFIRPMRLSSSIAQCSFREQVTQGTGGGEGEGSEPATESLQFWGGGLELE